MDDRFVWTTDLYGRRRFVWTTITKRAVLVDDAHLYGRRICIDGAFVWTTDSYGRRIYDTIQHGNVIIRSSINFTCQVPFADYHSISSTIITARSPTNPLRFLAHCREKNQCSCALGPCRMNQYALTTSRSRTRAPCSLSLTLPLGC
jgi:hypothetical protein